MIRTIRIAGIALLATCLTFFSGCDDPEPIVPALVIPDAYNGSAFTANASTELNIGTQLNSLVTEAKKGRAGTAVSSTTLNSLYTTGSPSLKSSSTTYYASKMEGTSGWLTELAKASGGATYTPGTPTGEGGTYGGFLFDENGLEMEQLIEKGEFSAVLYNHAVSVMNSSLDESTADKLLAIIGGNPTFPNSYTVASNPDRFISNYAARRTDKDDPEGYYFVLKNNLIKLQAAIAAGNNYTAEQQEAIHAIKETWEKVTAATVINYCHDVISKLNGSPSDAQKASALHAYGECVGFVHGWKTIPQQDKIISETQIDEILVLLNAPSNGTPTSYTFVTDALNQLPKLQQVMSKLKSIYGFTDKQVNEDFKKNWVTLQTR